MENGKMTRRTVSDSTITLMVHVTKVIGSRTNNTVKAKKSGQTTPAMKANTKTVKSTVKVSSFGPMAAPTLETFSKITSMESVSILGLMVVNTMVNGTPTKCMEQVFSHGTMDADTKVSTTTTRKKVVVFSPGLMDANTMDSGKMANSMVSVSIIPQEVMKRRANGLTASVWNGFLKKRNNEYFCLSFHFANFVIFKLKLFWQKSGGAGVRTRGLSHAKRT